TLVRDARRLLTVWARQDSGLHDYSGRPWSGLLAAFYAPRWQLWIDHLSQVAADAPQVDPGPFRAAGGQPGWHSGAAAAVRAAGPRGDVLVIAAEVLERYRAPIN